MLCIEKWFRHQEWLKFFGTSTFHEVTRKWTVRSIQWLPAICIFDDNFFWMHHQRGHGVIEKGRQKLQYFKLLSYSSRHYGLCIYTSLTAAYSPYFWPASLLDKHSKICIFELCYHRKFVISALCLDE